MSMTLKTTRNMCRGLSIVYKITTRRSMIDVRKKSDFSRKNRTTGSPGHVRQILGRELDPGGVSPNQRSRWKHAFSPLKHV